MKMSDVLEKFSVFSEISEQFKQNIKLFHVFNNWIRKNVLFVTNDDKVFAFGSNYCGMCGFGHNERVDTPQEIPELNGKQIKQFFMGPNFVLALNENNHAFGWGWNDVGQLGRGYTSKWNECLKPAVIPDLENIIEISCGGCHSLALDEQNNVFSWGRNHFGQVGCGKESRGEITRPVQLKEFPKIKSIHCYDFRSFAVTFDGLVYSWGDNEEHCLGHKSRDNIFKPELICGLNNVISVGFSILNTYFLTNEGNIHFCGRIHSREDEYHFEPKILETDLKFQSIKTLYYNAVLALSEETVYCLFRNTIKKSKYKTFFDYCLEEKGVTSDTIEREYIKLGSGEFGTVFKWLDKRDRKVYALKVIENTDQDKLKEGISLLFKCNEDFFVKYYDFWVKDNRFYIKMELCSTNLSKVIEEKNQIFETNIMTTTDYFISSHLMKEILECVQYLHELNIIHRDLKPQNILVNYHPKNSRFLKICDFGFATISENNKTTSHTLMTATTKYMAPEVFGQKNLRGDYNTKADIYSLGIIICNLFKYDSNDESSNEELKNNPDLKEQWSELESLIDKMLNPRYKGRPTCAEILEKSESWLIDKIEINNEILTQTNSFLFNYPSFKLKHQLTSTNENKNYFKENFVKIEDLGSGGFGSVIKVRNKTDQQIYAIKVIEMTIDEKHSFLEYQREVNLISKCSEEYVVKYFDSWIENNKLYIQMELCSDNLKNIIQQKKECFGRTESEAMTSTEFFISSQMFKEILDSIHYLHEMKPPIIHRDLKPNILVNFVPKNGKFLKLADFGLATHCDKTISQSKCLGTARYLAPEILNAVVARPRYSQKTDIYSLGRILSELFNYDITDDNQEINPELTEKWTQMGKLVETMLSTKYHSRPTCAQILEKYDFWEMDITRVDLNLVSNYENKFFCEYIRHNLNIPEFNERLSLKRISNEIIDSKVINKTTNYI